MSVSVSVHHFTRHLLAETLEEYNDVYYKIFKIFNPVPYMRVFCTGD